MQTSPEEQSDSTVQPVTVTQPPFTHVWPLEHCCDEMHPCTHAPPEQMSPWLHCWLTEHGPHEPETHACPSEQSPFELHVGGDWHAPPVQTSPWAHCELLVHASHDPPMQT